MPVEAATLAAKVEAQTQQAERNLRSVDKAFREAGQSASGAAPKIDKLSKTIDFQERSLSILEKELAQTITKYGQGSIQADKKALSLQRLSSSIEGNREKQSALRDAMERNDSTLGKLSAKFQAFGKGIASGFGIGAGIGALDLLAGGIMRVGGAIAGGIDDAGDFETNLNLIGAGSDEAKSRMDEFSNAAKALGSDLTLPGTSAADAAEAMLELSKAGLSVNDTLGAAKGVLQLSAAGQLSNAQAAEIAANALNAFGLAGDRATAVADQLAATANASSSDVKDLADGFSMAAAVFSSLQGPAVGAESAMTDLNTAMGILANNGIKGSDSGTSLKQSLLALAAPSDKAKGLMKDLAARVGEAGDLAYDASGQMRSYRDIIDIASRATADMTQEQRDYTIATIFGADATRAIAALMKEGVAGWDDMRTAVTKQGAAADLAQARMKGLGGAIEGFTSGLQTALLNGILPFLPGITKLVSAGGEFIGGFADKIGPVMEGVVSGLSLVAGIISDYGLPALSGLTAATLAYAAANVISAIPSIGSLITMVGTATTAFAANAVAVAAALAPFALIAAAVGGVVWAYQDLQEKAQGATDTLLDQREWWQTGVQALDSYATASEEVKEKIGGTATTLQDLMAVQRAEIEQQMSSGMAASQAQLDAWNSRAEVIRHYGEELSGAMVTELQAQAVSQGLISAVQGHTEAEGARAAAMQLSAEEMEGILKGLEEVRKGSIESIGAIISTDVELLGTLEGNRIAHKTRWLRSSPRRPSPHGCGPRGD